MTRQQRQYEARKAVGGCVKCPNQARPGRTICEACQEANREHKRRMRGTPPSRYRVTSAASRRWYEKRKRLGECVKCSIKLPHGHPWVRCAECQAEAKEIREEMRREADALELDAEGDNNVPRCRCGLALPCNDCIPGIEAFACRRPGSSTFPAPGGITLSPKERRAIAKVGSSKFSPRALQYKVRRGPRSAPGTPAAGTGTPGFHRVPGAGR